MPEASHQLDKINEVFQLALPAINAGEEPDIDQLAKQVGMDPENIRELIQTATDKARDMRK